MFYFGGVGITREQALREYLSVRDDLYAGRTPSPSASADAVAGQRVRELCIRYLAERKKDIGLGGLSLPDWKRRKMHLKRFAAVVGRERFESELRPEDFAEFARWLRRRKVSGRTFNSYRASIVHLFNFAEQMDWIDRAPKFGPGFAKVGGVELPNETFTYTPAMFAALVRAADPEMRAMLMLCANGGFGLSDLCALPWDRLDIGTIGFERTKTNFPRIVPLWPETVAALGVLKRTKLPQVFLTARGVPWDVTDICHEFRKLCIAAKVNVPPRKGLYRLRHTFSTIADEVGDANAKRRIKGQALVGMDQSYVVTIEHARLQRVTDHVRSRLEVAKLLGDLFQTAAPPAGRTNHADGANAGG